MATEWYLLKPPYSQLSGYESEALADFAEEGFAEALDSDIAVDVELCNYDLSVCKPIRVIIQNSVQDTKLQAFTRHVLAPIGTCLAGMYIKYKNRYWLIVGLVDDNGMYEKAVLTLCNWQLTWKNRNGDIIQRWANVTSASQYNNGQTENTYYVLQTDQLLICMPDDDECMMLDTGQRFIIDKRCNIYQRTIGNDIEVDTSHELITYELTRRDAVLYNYSDSGHYQILATQDEQHPGDGYYRIGEKGYWLCSDNPISIESKNDDKTDTLSLFCEIVADTYEIYSGLGAAEFTAVFYDESGKIITHEPTWDIRCDFADKLNVDYINNTIFISVDDIALLNKSFELFLSSDGYEPTKIDIKIVGLL